MKVLIIIASLVAAALSQQECGTPAIDPIEDGRIVGGIEAREHSWPWQVVMCSGSSTTSCRLRCGGSIIDNKHILTAAHCVQRISPSSITIKVGAHDYAGSVGTQHTVARIVDHPSYESPGRFSNDMSILELNDEIAFGDTVSPVCLPAADNGNTADGNSAFVTGWGSLRQNGPISRTLQQVIVPFVNNDQCAESYGSVIDGSMVCLGNYEQGGKDSCQGDSGGPVVKKSNGRYFQYGIVSFGSGCARPRFPGVYARVTEFCDVIADTTGSDLCIGGN